MKYILYIYCLTIVCVQTTFGQTAEKDTMVMALQEELSYHFKQLQQQPIPAYFMSLRMTDEQVVNIRSSMGNASCSENRQRTIVPQIRIGDMYFDNFKYVNQGTTNPNGRNTQGLPVPLDGHPISAIRHAIWKETLSRYDIACNNYSAAQARTMTVAANEDKAPCFSKAPVACYYEPEMPASAFLIDKMAWKEKINEVARVFKEENLLEDGNVSLTFSVLRTWFVNTEGTVVVQNRRTARIMLSASIKATDGMTCPLQQDFFAFHPDKLPSTDQLKEVARDMTQRLLALREAPIADPYSGPAILSGPASGVFFHEIFGHRLEGHRLKTGGETFKKKVGERILPEHFQVYCDPTLTRYGNTELSGHYRYDDEGVKGRRVNNVVDGVLCNFLMSRVPIDGFAESNGHGRTRDGNDPVSRQSNLIIETTHPYTELQLRQMLIDEARKQGKDYGYYFRTVTSGFTFTGEGNSLNSFNVSPVEVYRVFTDGRPDQLVRGVDMIGTPLSMFSNIKAAGDIPSTFTGECGAESGWVPVTATSPTIFVAQIETQRSKAQRQIPMLLPKPVVANEPTKQSSLEEDLILQAMQDEMKRTQTIQFASMPRPYFIDYRIARVKQIHIRSTLGGTTLFSANPIHTLGSVNLLLGDSCMTSEVKNGQSVQLHLTDELNYQQLRTELWKASDAMYKYAAGSMASKRNYLAQHPRNSAESNVPEQFTSAATRHLAPSILKHTTNEKAWKKLADQLSHVFTNYPSLYDTQVTIECVAGDAYRITSEGLCLRLPIGFTVIEASAKTKCTDGSEITDRWQSILDVNTPLPNYTELCDKIRKFAEKLQAGADSETVNEYYSGPVLYEGEAVVSTFANHIVKPILIATRSLEEGSGKNSLMLGKRILDNTLQIQQITDVTQHAGTVLIGSYERDADGRIPLSIDLVKDGILRNLLCGRHAAMGCTQSTGNERFMDRVDQGLYTHAAIGTLKISSTKGNKQTALRKLLAKEAKKAGLDYAFIIRSEDGGALALYRYDCNTGHEFRLRAKEVPLAIKTELMHICGVSNEEIVTNMLLDGNKVSIICPRAMVVENLEFHFEAPPVTTPAIVKRR